MQRSDRISALPQDTIEQILSLMPIRDAVRTSILSRKWRFSWTNIPKLVFDDEFVNALSDSEKKINKYKLVSTIFHILLLHKGPISELCIYIANTEIDNEIDPVMLHLSLSKTIKKFIFYIKKYDELPCSFFSLQGLEHISLKCCDLKLPLMFNGFSMIKGLVLNGVGITFNMLQRFLTGSPLLEEFTMIVDGDLEVTEIEFVKLLKCLPSIQVLEIPYLEIKALGDMPRNLPISLPNLRILNLGVCIDELSSVVCVISNSPNLEKIKLEMCWVSDWEDFPQTRKTLIDDEDYAGLNLGHLREMEITGFNNFGLEMEFVKLIMAKSPVLKKARLELSKFVSVDQENEMLRDLLYFSLPRESSAASFTIERPKDCSTLNG